MRREEKKNRGEKSPGPQSPSNPHKESAGKERTGEAEKECPSRKWRLRIPVRAAQREKERKRKRENIFIKFMPAPTSARAPVNRFPEDVDQFRLERRRGSRKRKRQKEREKASTKERKNALSPSRRAREPSLHPPSASSSPPTLFFPPSATLSICRSPPIPLNPPSHSFFESPKKCALRAELS